MNSRLRITFDTSTNPLISPVGFGTPVEANAGGDWYDRYMSSTEGMTADLDAEGATGIKELLILLGTWS